MYIKYRSLYVCEGNPKPFWGFVKSARKGTNNLVSLLVDGVTLTDDLSITQSMNQFYSSVSTSEDCDNFPNIDYVVTSKISNIYCSVNEIEKLLKNLNAYKSPGPDGFSPRILRECASPLSPSICALINKSFAGGQLPSKWKWADVTPIPSARSCNTGLNSDELAARDLFQACVCVSPSGVAFSI